MEINGWTYDEGPNDLVLEPDLECTYEAKLPEYNNNVYWDAENDVVGLKHEKDPHVCDPRSFCNAYQRVTDLSLTTD